MADDLAEQSNHYRDQLELVAQMLALLEKNVMSGRSTEGGSSANDPDAQIELWKSGRDAK